MRAAAAACVIAATVAAALAIGQPAAIDPQTEGQLRQLFPSASSFAPKGGAPPHFKAFDNDPQGARVLAGYAFWTTELAPLERGYDGPIKILVGMTAAGILTGVVVVDHHEPYGYFSVDTPEFAKQFKGKSVRDLFRVGGDVDAISRASLTVGSAARAIRDSSRRIATRLIAPPRQ
jgi:NosR/NirI family transcriptional regulator, nitrous oxide reductase regulator